MLLAALGKLTHWRILPGVIANYRLLPRAALAPAALLLPPVELVLGAALKDLVAALRGIPDGARGWHTIRVQVG